MPVSIKDVATAANVSIATVSRVLNNPGLVAAETADRVRKAVDELGYRPNLFAKGLMTKRSRVLGVSLPDWSGDSYSDLMRGADTRARELGYHLLVSSNAHRGSDGPIAPSFALDLVDGLIAMVTRSTDADIEQLARLDMPVVVLTSDVTGVEFDTVELDNVAGAREACRHLLAGTPADRCVFVGGPEGSIDSDRRCRTFVEAVAEAGHTAAPEQIARGTWSYRWGWQWADGAVARGELKGKAIFAGNDEIAFGIIARAADAGIDVPGDLRIVGFDDSRACPFVSPPVSSVRVPSFQIGAEAVNAMVARLEEPEAETAHLRLATQLVIRESSQY